MPELQHYPAAGFVHCRGDLAPAVDLGLGMDAGRERIAGPLLFGGDPDFQRAVFAALTVLVMGYPCAVGISAPLSIVRGAGEAADKGVLMRTG